MCKVMSVDEMLYQADLYTKLAGVLISAAELMKEIERLQKDDIKPNPVTRKVIKKECSHGPWSDTDLQFLLDNYKTKYNCKAPSSIIRHGNEDLANDLGRSLRAIQLQYYIHRKELVKD